MAERICVAQIGGAHGLRGEVKLKSFTGDPMAVADYAPLTSEDGASFEIEALRPAKGHLVARFRGVEGRTSAERLAQWGRFLPRGRLPPPSAPPVFPPPLAGEGWGEGDSNALSCRLPPPCPSPASGGGDDVASPCLVRAACGARPFSPSSPKCFRGRSA